ncbi:MAG: CBS domain-containing protein [Pseudobacteriovorax sp.]|nr:CBS domain-containing protein [Pseudobacteriovorax sp.]
MQLSDYVAKIDKPETKSIPIESTLGEIYDLMSVEGLQYVAVERNGNFAGVIGLMSILKGIMVSPQTFNKLEARDLLVTKVPVLTEKNSVEDLIDALKEKKTKAVPYVVQGKFHCLLTQEDLLNLLRDLLEQDHGILEDVEAKGEIFMANPLVQKVMKTLSDIGI